MEIAIKIKPRMKTYSTSIPVHWTALDYGRHAYQCLWQLEKMKYPSSPLDVSRHD
jgi:hypothetical protein